MKKLLAPVLLLCVLCLAMPVAAQTQPAEEAARLKSIFDKMIERNSRPGEKDYTMEFDGNVVVEPAGSYYAVTLPALKIRYADGHVLDAGMIAVNAAPDTKPGFWSMAIALPTPLTLFKPEGSVFLKIYPGRQKMNGLYDEKLLQFTSLKGTYEDARVELTSPAYKFNIRQTDIKYDVGSDAEGKLSGSALADFHDIKALSAAIREPLDGGNIMAALTFTGYKPGTPVNSNNASAKGRVVFDSVQKFNESLTRAQAQGIQNPQEMLALTALSGYLQMMAMLGTEQKAPDGTTRHEVELVLNDQGKLVFAGKKK